MLQVCERCNAPTASDASLCRACARARRPASAWAFLGAAASTAALLAGAAYLEAAWGKRPHGFSSTLTTHARDLTAAAKADALDPVIGREDEIERLVAILSRRSKNNPILVGEPGVGKTAIVEGLAQRIARGSIPRALQGKRVLALAVGSLVAGTKYRGEFENRIKNILDEVRARAREVILFIDEAHTLVGAGAAEGSLDFASMIKPELARGDLQCIAATTLYEYELRIKADAALERRFQPVMVGEPSVEETIAILRGLRPKYAAHHGVVIEDAALEAAAHLSARHIVDRHLPDKAIDLMDEAAATVALRVGTTVSEDDVRTVAMKWSGVRGEALD
jgi:ATP-dependent Clp protease ATP-binding subunit ClpA